MARHFARFACALVCTTLLGTAAARAADASGRPPQASTNLSAYRTYANTQAEMLVRMTKVLAMDVANRDVDAAQNDYAMTHRYLERIKPMSARLDRELDERMDAAVGGAAGRPDPAVSGFRRIEHDLFAARSTDGLAVYADRLHDDALHLQKIVATGAMPVDDLVDGATETLSAGTLVEGSEPYSKTQLWDIEARIDGTREIFAAIRPQIAARDPLLAADLSGAFATADDRLSRFRAGCGFKYFDELSRAEKANLEEATTALARQLSRLKTRPTID